MSDHGYTDEQIFAEKLRKAGRDMQITGAAMMAGIAKTLFSHRNGEREQPTISGHYWFRGTFGRHECADMVEVGTDRCSWWMGDFALTEANGRWYGPVTPPWETNDSIQNS